MSDETELPNEVMERHETVVGGEEHAHEHVNHGGKITLLILVLAMAAAIAGKISAENEMRYLTYEIELSDTWAQYQGKSDRQAIAQGFANLAAVLPNADDPKVAKLIADMTATANRLNVDDKGEGKSQLADKAKKLAAERDEAAGKMEGFSMTVVMLAIAIGLGSASMLSRQALPKVALSLISAVAGVGAAIYGLLVGIGKV
jgi:hypothetical protein